MKPEVADLLRMLREQTPQMKSDISLHGGEVALVQQISAQVASLTTFLPVTPDPAALVKALRHEVRQLKQEVRLRDVGTVQYIGTGVATLSGLPRVCTDELVTFPTGVQGMILNLENLHVDVILLGAEEGIQGGDLVKATGERLRVPVGKKLLGRVLNPLGIPLDGEGPVEAADYLYLERDAPGIVDRAPVSQPLHTGLKVVDALVPVGRGQRELIVGDRQTGKTTLAVDTIINQRNGLDSEMSAMEHEVDCIYVAIGQKKSTTLAVIETLRQTGALAYTTIVMSSPDDPPALRYLAPYAGCTMAEFLMHQGRDVLIVYDDLSKHADAYRELSLLLRRPPGREAYPGDIFYLHSRLLERSSKLCDELGGGSLTALPIVETQRGNLSAYIPTNLISITDGQIVLDADLFNRGVKPAVNPGQSVSRVGGAAQTSAMRAVAGRLRLDLSQFEEVARFARIGAEVDEATQHQIQRGLHLQTALTQPANRPLPLALQIVLLLAVTEGHLDDVPLEELRAFERDLSERVKKEHPALVGQLERTGALTVEMRQCFLETAQHQHDAWYQGRVEV